MTQACVRCGHDKDVLRFCALCGAEQPHHSAPGEDPMIGSLIAERYQITSLVAAGGMGRVYRAVQRSLDRTVAIKVIHPHLNTSPDVVSRFLREARAVSRLNHPNVVSIFDFGSVQPQGLLYLVMELVSGPDLGTILRSEDRLPLAQVGSIMRQTLAALAEAHHLGITHRDVKPDNILLEPRRGGGSHVKVIDFGIARSEERGVTEWGMAIGTPHYMAPEIWDGSVVGPSADLYAAGVVLFQLLTGKLPFDGPTAMAIYARHSNAPRPDPRTVAPDREITSDMVDVCQRAIAADPGQRYVTAEALATAIVRASTATRVAIVDSSLPPSPAPDHPVPSIPPHRAPAESLYDVDVTPLMGRSDLLATASEALRDRHVSAIALYGAEGVGCSRMLHEIRMLAMRSGYFVVEANIDPPPLSEEGWSGLREIVARLVGAQRGDAGVILEKAGQEAAISAALEMIWKDDIGTKTPRQVRAAATAALRWAVQRARGRVDGATLALTIDDVDRMDDVSKMVLADLVSGERQKGLLLLTSSQDPPAWPSDRVRLLEVVGISSPDAAVLLSEGVSLGDRAEPVEPFYVQQLRKLGPVQGALPEDLPTLLHQQIAALSTPARRLLEAVAATGGGPLDHIAAVLSRPGDLLPSLRPLSEAGIIEVHQGAIRLTHALFGRIALEAAPPDLIMALHGRVAGVLADKGGSVEVRAHHAVRGPPGQAALALLDEAARLRARRGDHEGVIAACWEGIQAAERASEAGSAGAVDATYAFLDRLADALLELRRYHEAAVALNRALQRTDLPATALLGVYERLSRVAVELRRPGEAERWRREARKLERALRR